MRISESRKALRLPASLAHAIDAIAAEDATPASAVMRRLLAEAVDREVKRRGPRRAW